MNHKRSHKIGRRAVLAAQRLRSFRSHLSMPGRVATWGPKEGRPLYHSYHSTVDKVASKNGPIFADFDYINYVNPPQCE